MSKVDHTPRKAPAARTTAAMPPLLPAPNPFPCGVVPFRPSTEVAAQPSPTVAPPVSRVPSDEAYPGDEDLVQLMREVVEVINLDDPDASPTYEALPNLAKKATGAKPMQTASVPPSASGTPLAGVLGPLAATAIMFDDAPCPPLDPFAKYWVSLHGVEAGVFNSNAFLPMAQGSKGKGPGPKSLAAAFDAWKRACVTGGVPASKPISPNSVFPRILRKRRGSMKAPLDAKAARDGIITNFFRLGTKDGAERAAPFSDDNAMAIDTVGNIFQSGATGQRPHNDTFLDPVTTEGAVMLSSAKAGLVTPKVIRKKRTILNKIQSRPASICSSDGSDSGSSTRNFDLTMSGASSGYHTPPVQSPILSPIPQLPIVAPQPVKNLHWVVIAGKVPGIYFTEEKTAECAGRSSSRRICAYESFWEASQAYSAAARAGQILVLLDD